MNEKPLYEQPLLLTGGVEYNEYPITTLYSQNPLMTGLTLYGESKLLPLRIYQRAKILNQLNSFNRKNNVPNIYWNAIRHRGGSALMSNDFLGTPQSARYWGNIKEISDLVTRKEDDTRTDLSNNELGRRLADQNRGISQEELLNKVYEDIKENPNPPVYKDTPLMNALWNKFKGY